MAPSVTRRTLRYASRAVAVRPLGPLMCIVARVSARSDRRITSAQARDWASSRNASSPASRSGSMIASNHRVVGARRTRSVSSVMTPSTPSLPRNRARRSGPAAEEGARPSRRVPRGVATTRASTVASLRPYPVEAWPAERVAAYPPMLARSQDCGTCPQVRPRAASSRSRTGPVMPGCTRAVPETASTSSSSAIRSKLIATTPDLDPASGRTPPTTLVPPPKGTTANPPASAAASRATTSSCEPGETTASGASGCLADRRSSRSTYDSPPAWARRASRSVRTWAAPTAAVRPAMDRASRRDGAGSTWDRATAGEGCGGPRTSATYWAARGSRSWEGPAAPQRA